MSEKLSIEVLRDQFIRTQTDKRDLIATSEYGMARITDVGIKNVYYRYTASNSHAYAPIDNFLSDWEIKYEE